MKNYAITKEAKQKFIKKYTIYDVVDQNKNIEEEIYITLGNNKEYIIPSTKENENLVKARMKRQVREYIKAYKIIEEEMSISFRAFKDIEIDLPFIPFSREYIDKMIKQEENIKRATSAFLGSTLTIGTISCLFFMENLSLPTTILMTTIFSIPFITTIPILKHYQKKYDLVKNYYFIENEPIYQNNYPKENLTIGLREKAEDYFEKLEEPLSINDLDHFSLSDLRKLKENIERFEDFDFKEEKQLKLTLK